MIAIPIIIRLSEVDWLLIVFVFVEDWNYANSLIVRDYSGVTFLKSILVPTKRY